MRLAATVVALLAAPVLAQSGPSPAQLLAAASSVHATHMTLRGFESACEGLGRPEALHQAVLAWERDNAAVLRRAADVRQALATREQLGAQEQEFVKNTAHLRESVLWSQKHKGGSVCSELPHRVPRIQVESLPYHYLMDVP